jgi:Haem-degrading
MRAKHMGLHSAAVVLVLAAATAPPTARAEDVITLHRLSAALASEAVTEAVASCAKQGYKVSAAILNMDGLPQAVLRGDGATGTSFDAAQDKAYTAIMLGATRNEDSTGVINASRPVHSRAVFCDALPIRPLIADDRFDQKRIDASSQYRHSTGWTARVVSSQPLIQPSPGINLQGNKSTYRPNASSKRTSKFFSIGAVEMGFHSLSLSLPAKSMPAIAELRLSSFTLE